MYVRHSGNCGDVLTSLWVVQEMAKHDTIDLLLITDVKQDYTEPHPLGNVRLSKEWAEELAPLLLSQPYINSVEAIPEAALREKRFQTTRVLDLDTFRLASVDYQDGPSSRWYGWATGLCADTTKPSISVDPLPDLKDQWVIACTSRNRNPMIFYDSICMLPCVFVGLSEEYENFHSSLPHVPYHHTKDWLILARLLAGSKGLIGNQGAIFALAEALKIPRLLEVPLKYANAHPVGGAAYEAKTPAQWEYGIELRDAQTGAEGVRFPSG